ETTLPGSSAEYYKLNYEFSKYWPISRALVLNTRVELGYGDSYGSEPERVICRSLPGQPLPVPGSGDATDTTNPADGLCGSASVDSRALVGSGRTFFVSFYAGGARSVRGIRDSTLDAREAALGSSSLQPIGGAHKTIGSVEMFFPQLIKSPAASVS